MGGSIRLGSYRRDGNRSPTVKSRYTTTCKAQEVGNTDGSYGVVLFQLSSCLVEIDAICIFTVKAQTGWKCVRRNDGWF